jgi:hypothetical protein
VEAGDIRGIDVWESTRGTSQGILLEQTDHCGAARTNEGNEWDMHCLRTLGPDKVRSPSQACKVPVGFVSDFLLYAICAPHGILYRYRSLPVAMVVNTEISSGTCRHETDET